MEALAKITQISPVYETTTQSGEKMSRIVVTFLIGAKTFHVTAFKKSENLARWPFSSDGYIEGAIGTLSIETTSEMRYSQKDNTPYVNYRVNHRWNVEHNVQASTPTQQAATAQAPTDQQQVAEMMADAAASVPLDPGTGLPF